MGKQIGSIAYPTLGAATELHGRADSNEGFYSFESFIIPPTIYHYDVDTGKTEIFAKPTVPFASDQYEVKQVFYKSKDGTRVPMFISSKKGVQRDGNTPTLMCGLWRIPDKPDPGVEPRICLVDGARRLLCPAQSARWG